MPIRHLILDWSGTLVDDLLPVFHTTNHVLTACGRVPLSMAEFRREFCLPVSKFYRTRIPDVSQAELERMFLDEYPAHRHEIRPLPHTREFLIFCTNTGRHVFVASSADRQTYTTQMARYGLAQFITRAYLEIADKTKAVHQILAENALLPAETMFVGDMAHDIEAGKAGAVRTCAVLTGYNHGETLRALGPDLVCADLRELQAALAVTEECRTHG